jgi:hypothetical protein
MVEGKRIDSFRRKRSVPNPADDIQKLNERLLLIASDQALGGTLLRTLGAGAQVIKRIRTANAQAVATAIRCSVPLIVFTDMVEELASTDPRQWRWSSTNEVPTELRDLALFALNFAHDLALRNITMAKGYFGVSRLTAERLGELAVAHLETLSRAPGPLLRLRSSDDLNWWDRLLIGDRCVGPRAPRIAHTAAQQTLSNK